MQGPDLPALQEQEPPICASGVQAVFDGVAEASNRDFVAREAEVLTIAMGMLGAELDQEEARMPRGFLAVLFKDGERRRIWQNMQDLRCKRVIVAVALESLQKTDESPEVQDTIGRYHSREIERFAVTEYIDWARALVAARAQEAEG